MKKKIVHKAPVFCMGQKVGVVKSITYEQMSEDEVSFVLMFATVAVFFISIIVQAII